MESPQYRYTAAELLIYYTMIKYIKYCLNFLHYSLLIWKQVAFQYSGSIPVFMPPIRKCGSYHMFSLFLLNHVYVTTVFKLPHRTGAENTVVKHGKTTWVQIANLCITGPVRNYPLHNFGRTWMHIKFKYILYWLYIKLDWTVSILYNRSKVVSVHRTINLWC